MHSQWITLVQKTTSSIMELKNSWKCAFCSRPSLPWMLLCSPYLLPFPRYPQPPCQALLFSWSVHIVLSTWLHGTDIYQLCTLFWLSQPFSLSVVGWLWDLQYGKISFAWCLCPLGKCVPVSKFWKTIPLPQGHKTKDSLLVYAVTKPV